MNINPVSFGKVYAIYGTKNQIIDTYNGIYDSLDEKKSTISFINATEIYQKNRGNGILTKAAHDGKEVGFIVTGKEDNDKINFMRFGWTSINGVSHHIYKAFDLDKIEGKDIRGIKISAHKK